jgi:hypothetical protein
VTFAENFAFFAIEYKLNRQAAKEIETEKKQKGKAVIYRNQFSAFDSHNI